MLAERLGDCSFCLADYGGVGWRRQVEVGGQALEGILKSDERE